LPAGQGCRLGGVGIVEADYAQGQVHYSRAPIDQREASATILNGWFRDFRRQSAICLLLLLTSKERCIVDNRGVFLTLYSPVGSSIVIIFMLVIQSHAACIATSVNKTLSVSVGALHRG